MNNIIEVIPNNEWQKINCTQSDKTYDVEINNKGDFDIPRDNTYNYTSLFKWLLNEYLDYTLVSGIEICYVEFRDMFRINYQGVSVFSSIHNLFNIKDEIKECMKKADKHNHEIRLKQMEDELESLHMQGLLVNIQINEFKIMNDKTTYTVPKMCDGFNLSFYRKKTGIMIRMTGYIQTFDIPTRSRIFSKISKITPNMKGNTIIWITDLNDQDFTDVMTIIKQETDNIKKGKV